MSFENQLKHIEERCADPQWHDVILGLTHLTTRPQDVRQIVERLRNAPGDNIAKFGIDTILCEIAVGPFQCPPDVCLDLCSTFVREVEVGAWMPQRLALLRLLLSGIYSSKVGTAIRDRLSNWYPCRNAYRTDLYSTLVLVNNDEAVRGILFQVLRDEQPYNQEAAAIAIADQSSLQPELSERLKEMIAAPNALSVIVAALEALVRGWPNHEIWDDLEPRIRHCASIELRLIAIRRRIAARSQEENDLKELRWMVSRSGPFMWRRSDVVTKAIVEGWPGDVAIRDDAIRCMNPRMLFEDGLDANAAVRLLIAGYSSDPIATAALASLIRTEEHAFSDSHWIWKAISEKYVGNSEMIAAADECLSAGVSIVIPKSLLPLGLVGRTKPSASSWRSLPRGCLFGSRSATRSMGHV